MDKKEKISMILKILLVLVLVPMSISFGSSDWSNEKDTCQQFTSTTQPNLYNYIKNNTTGESYDYDYTTAVNSINRCIEPMEAIRLFI